MSRVKKLRFSLALITVMIIIGQRGLAMNHVNGYLGNLNEDHLDLMILAELAVIKIGAEGRPSPDLVEENYEDVRAQEHDEFLDWENSLKEEVLVKPELSIANFDVPGNDELLEADRAIINDHAPAPAAKVATRALAKEDVLRGIIKNRKKRKGRYPCPYENCRNKRGLPSTFSYSANRSRHVNRTHTKRKKYVCPVQGCPKVCYTSCDLTDHSYSHSSKIKPFVCPRCGHDFLRKHHLKRHQAKCSK